MNKTNTPIQIDLSITVLEDLHSGTGTGNTLVDSIQARDSEGYPVIDRHHFRGVLRDNAIRLMELGIIKEKEFIHLFGEAGNKQRHLDCSSLTAANKNCLITWESTARQKGSRCPEENSLRRIEYIKAGTTLTGSITLSNPTPDTESALQAILKFTTRLGSERTRGSGQIKIVQTPKNIKPTVKINTPALPNSIKVLLKNTEPLCIPKTGHAGNIIHTESYIPGRTLFAALAKAALDNGDKETFDKLFAGKASIGNAYPIPDHLKKENLDTSFSIPVPNHIHGLKQESQEKLSAWPHWAKPKNRISPVTQLDNIKDIDLFLDKETDQKTERPKGEKYLIHHKTAYYRYTQPLSIRMRNKRGDPFGKKKDGKEITRGDTELFSEQRIPENTLFLGEIYSEDQQLLDKIYAYLSNPISIGRGKAPVVKLSHYEIKKPDTPVTREKENEVIIIAASDWIIRGENLGYLTKMDKNTLEKALKVSFPENVKLESYQETETQGSFNYATQLPKRPFEVIRRGSSFKLTFQNSEQAKTLLDKLNSPTAIGERTSEGYGKYIINPTIKLLSDEEVKEEKNNIERLKQEEDENKRKQMEENKKALLAEKKKICQKYFQQCKDNSISAPPDKNSWDKLKKDILSNEENITYQGIVSNYRSDPQLNFIYRDQKSKNMGKRLDDLIKNNSDKDKQALITDFIECFELHLYPEES